MKNAGRAYFKAIVLSWKTYVLLPYLILMFLLANVHLLVLYLKLLFETIHTRFVWLGTYTSKPAKWWRETSPRIAEIDAIRLKEYQDELMARRRRNVFHKIEEDGDDD